MHWQVTLTFVLVTIFYAVIGGVVFHFLERDFEVQLKSEVLTEIDALCSGGCLNGSDIALLKSILSDMYIGGLEITPDGQSLANYTRWDMASSIFVAIQIFSSVGFGRVAPASYKGHVACLVFGLLGIPLFFAVAMTAGHLIDLLGRRFCSWTWVKRCCRPRVATVVFYVVTAATGLILLVVVPSAIFSSMEKWSYGEGFYFCLTTLFTLGFSDYLPGYNHNRGLSDEFLSWYRLATGFWIIFLIFWYGTFLNLVKKNATRWADRAEEIAADKLRNKVKVLTQNQENRRDLKAEDLKTLEDVIRKGQYTTVVAAGLTSTTTIATN